MSARLGFYLTFAAWLPGRFRDLPGTLKEDFCLDLIALFQTMAPIVESFPRKKTIGTLFTWLVGNKDPLAPVRDGIRAFQTKWSA
jgi:hypothetical protein